MKKTINQIKKATRWIWKYLQLLWIFIIDIGGMFRSIWILQFHKIHLPAIFKGHFHFYFAKRYATKRYENWENSWDQLGRQQGILPFRETDLIVCSPLELKMYQKKGMFNDQKNYKKYFKNSKVVYWKTTKTLKQYKLKIEQS